MHKSENNVKTFLKSKKAEELVTMMIENNIKTKHYYDYDIIFDGTFWYAWFEVDISHILESKIKKA